MPKCQIVHVKLYSVAEAQCQRAANLHVKCCDTRTYDKKRVDIMRFAECHHLQRTQHEESRDCCQLECFHCPSRWVQMFVLVRHIATTNFHDHQQSRIERKIMCLHVCTYSLLTTSSIRDRLHGQSWTCKCLPWLASV